LVIIPVIRRFGVTRPAKQREEKKLDGSAYR
jgi:hypothetical protein